MSGMLPFVVFVVLSSYAFQKDRDFFPAMKWFRLKIYLDDDEDNILERVENYLKI